MRLQFQNTLHMPTIQEDAEDKKHGKTMGTICDVMVRFAVTSSARCVAMIPFHAHTFQNLRDTLYKQKIKKIDIFLITFLLQNRFCEAQHPAVN